jgi:hypothetical protein
VICLTQSRHKSVSSLCGQKTHKEMKNQKFEIAVAQSNIDWTGRKEPAHIGELLPLKMVTFQ